MIINCSLFDPCSRWYYPLRWLFLLFLGLAIYGQTFGFDFVFDDNFFILNTPYIRSFDLINQIWAILPKTRMVGIYSFALNYSINHLNPQGYHIFNFLVHLLAVGLVWALASLLFKIAECKAPELPFFIALLFLVHPCQTQAVSYISQRFESMATVFYLGSIYFYLRGRISPILKHKILFFGFCIGLAFLGILTKEVAATIPLTIMAAEGIFFTKKRSSGKVCFILMALSLLFFMVFMKLARTDLSVFFNSHPFASASHDGDVITSKGYLLTQMRVFLTFMRLLALPIHQNLDYDYPLSTGILHPPLTLIGMCFIGMIIFLSVKLRERHPLIAFGLAWVLITFSINLAPRANIIFEHKLYLISFGFLLVMVSALSIIIRESRLLVGLLITIIIVLSAMSFLRNQVWQNEMTLWQDVTQKSPHKAKPYNGLGVAYGLQGNVIEAISNFDKAIEINPDFPEALNNRGNAYIKQGNYSQAKIDLNRAIAIKPDLPQAYTNLGVINFQEGNLKGSLSDYNKAIELNVYYADAYYNRGIFFIKLGNLVQAFLDLNKAIELNPNNAEAFISRGNIYYKQGRLKEALSDYNKAIAINPNIAGAYYNRSLIYSTLGNNSQALADHDKAVEMNPDLRKAY